MRAALLPASADPFLNAYWLRHFTTWANQVDELKIAVCGELEPAVMRYTRGLVRAIPNATMYHLPLRTDHGTVIGYLLKRTKADHIMLCEDDAFVREPGRIDEAFRRIESGEVDLVGCPRGFASPEVEIAAQRFGEPNRVEGGDDQGYAFWPCFLFVARANLLRTDGNFSVKSWRKGEYEPVLDHTFAEDAATDTLVWASYQLRALGLRIRLERNYRITGDTTNGPWFHVGSLSSGYGYSFLGPPEQRQIVVDNANAIRDDWAKRVAWWQRAWACWDGGIPAHHEAYGAALAELMAAIGVRQSQVDILRANYTHLVSWPEQP